MKTCKRCNIEQNESEFRINKNNKVRDICKECGRVKYREYYKNTITIRKQNMKKQYQKNKIGILKTKKEYRLKHAHILNEQKREYRKKNRKYLSDQHKLKKQNDIEYKLKGLLRGRMYRAIKNGSGFKTGHSQELLGCDWKTAKSHLEGLFTEGMSWDNHGNYGWHIDHIVPCSAFNLTDPKQQRECFHYTNLQPLWAIDNLSKGNAINEKWGNI